MGRRDGWGFREGDEIAPGRRAVRLLGGGRRYEAYLAWDDDLRCLVVAKVLRPGHLTNATSRRGLAAEAAMLERLNHPAIVRSFGAAPDDDRPHIVLEFLDGPRLSTLVRRYGLAIEQVLSLGLQLCAALHYMHRRGVVHLDVKPRNIIMAGPPRLIDLSIARPVDDMERVVGPIGTAGYMPPEQDEGGRTGEIGPASDMFGLGATLYEAVTSRRLADQPPGTAPFPPRARVPQPLADVIERCVAPRPEGRPSAAEVADILEPLVADLPRPRLGLFRPGGGRRG